MWLICCMCFSVCLCERQTAASCCWLSTLTFPLFPLFPFFLFLSFSSVLLALYCGRFIASSEKSFICTFLLFFNFLKSALPDDNLSLFLVLSPKRADWINHVWQNVIKTVWFSVNFINETPFKIKIKMSLTKPKIYFSVWHFLLLIKSFVKQSKF